jgi:SAM-dependent methyltransferase
MDPAEYANLAALEREHWYYLGKRELVRHWLREHGTPHRPRTLLDCGAGTGAFAEEMVGEWRVLVLDDHEESLRRLKVKFPADCVLRVSATGIPLGSSTVDAVTALDVFEHIENDSGAVSEIHRVLKPGGVLVATVPASMALWSDWDESLHHFRRYNRAGFVALFSASQWEMLHVNYTNVLAFPAVWFLRKWRRWSNRKAAKDTQSRSEDVIPSSWLNRLLCATFVGLGKSRVPFPFGVSLLLVARKR